LFGKSEQQLIPFADQIRNGKSINAEIFSL